MEKEVTPFIGNDEIKGVIEKATTLLKRRYRTVGIDMVDDAVTEQVARWWTDAPEQVHTDALRSLRWIALRANTYLIDLLRRERWQVELDSDNDYDGRASHSPAARFDQRQELDVYLARLAADSFEQIVAIVYHDLYGYSMNVVASELHCSIDAAYQHHSRAMKKLREIAFSYSPGSENRAKAREKE